VTVTSLPERSSAIEPLVLVAAFGAAVVVRMALAGYAGPASLPAGLAFAAVLIAFAVARRPHTRIGLVPLLAGVTGAAALVLPAVLVRGLADQPSAGSYARWSAAVVVIAAAEEAFLRGALFDALDRWRGSDVAVVGAAVAFAVLHVPLYGWHVLPLDFAVGLLLGALRLATGTWTAPGLAHIGADLAGWWFA
jgi:membrane protease YdiL (CAAX protease family)